MSIISRLSLPLAGCAVIPSGDLNMNFLNKGSHE